MTERAWWPNNWGRSLEQRGPPVLHHVPHGGHRMIDHNRYDFEMAECHWLTRPEYVCLQDRTFPIRQFEKIRVHLVVKHVVL